MLSKTYVFNDVEDLINFLRSVQKENPDSVFVSSVNHKTNIAVPTKRKKYTSLNLTNSFAPDTFNGNSVLALSKSATMTLSFVPKEYINQESLVSKEVQNDGTENNAKASESKILEVIESTKQQ
jgi:hypothetical protein